jgi:hypothetical protein
LVDLAFIVRASFGRHGSRRQEEAIMCEAGDVLGWRVDGDPVLPYDSMDDGLTRISRSPILKPDLGRTEPFPFSVARTYSIQVLCCRAP